LVKLEYPECEEIGDSTNSVVAKIKSAFPDSSLMILTEDSEWYHA
jgi:hypothetical protein